MSESDQDARVLIDQDGVTLSTAIELLRAELTEAIDSGAGERLRFTTESIELELEITAKKTVKANGKVSLWKVATLGGGRDNETAAKHRLKLVLKPHDTTVPAGGETLIGDDD